MITRLLFRRGGPVEKLLQWMVIKKWLQRTWLLAASVEVAVADAGTQDPANNQDPEADGGLNDGLAPTDPVAPPMSVGRRQPNEPTEAERLAHNRRHIPFADWCESCVRGRGRDDPHRARQDHVEGNPIPVVQCDYFFFKAEKEDILCKAISAIDSVYNRTMALECEFKGLSDQAVPKHLKEYLKSLGFEKGSGARRPRRSSQQCVGPRNRWTVRVDTETVTSQGQTSTRACGTVPCNPRRTDAYLEKRCSEEVRCTFASTPSDSGMARQTLCVVA